MEPKQPELVEVVKIHDSTLRDIPARLRVMAELIEGGGFGEVETCAVVLVARDASQVSVFGYGDRSEHDTVGLALLAGANQAASNRG